ncbi:MAG: nucleotidyltransferase [Verrucomicrobiae bacterium]|nr:nucleotidyltransferase [Verrucomicrobiae bacterium]
MTPLETILDIASQLPSAGVNCLLIGGFAVNYYGYTRNTLDVDFMIVSEQLDIVKRNMIQAGFTNISIQDNAAFFNFPGSPLRVDFLRTNDATMRQILAGASLVRLHGHEIKIPSLKDLIAMKIFSLSQEPVRRMGKDLPDIAYLSVLHNLDLEADLRPLCERFGTAESYELIRGQVETLRISS